MATRIDIPCPHFNLAVTRRSKGVVKELIANIARAITGSRPDPENLRQIFFAFFARQMLHDIHTAFMEKSTGGVDETGDSWEPLAPSTIEYKRRKRSGTLIDNTRSTVGQRRIWQDHYRRALQQYRAMGFSSEDSETSARRYAWDRLQRSRHGAPDIPIGIDTGRLETSLRPAPATLGYHPTNRDQIAIIPARGVATFGTSVPYAHHFHKKRPIFPPADRMQSWSQRATAAGRDGVLRHLQRILQ